MKEFKIFADAMAEAEKVEPIAAAVYELIEGLDDVQLSMVLGCVVGRWAAHHKLSNQQTFEILEALTMAQKDVHGMIGAWEE